MVAKNDEGESKMDFEKYYSKLKDDLTMLMNKIPDGDSKADVNKRNKIFEIFDADSSGTKDGLVQKNELISKIKEWSGADNLMDFELGLDFVWTYL